MKSLKLITLGLIASAQISLISAMSEPKELQIDKIQQENLTTSIKRRNLQGMRDAVQKGANIDFQNELGQTPLMLAVLDLSYSSSPELKPYRFIEFLILSGANINQADSQGNTSLLYAVAKDIKDSFGLLTLLISNGANVNTQNELGETALIIASKIGNDEMLTALIDMGRANVNLTDKTGKTAFDYYKQDNKAIKALLMPETEKKRLEELELQKALQKISEIEEKERKEKEDKKRLELLQERDRLLVQRAKEELQMQKEEEQLRTQRAQEVLAQMAAQSQEENWEEEQPGEAVEGSGEAEEGWENSEFQD